MSKEENAKKSYIKKYGLKAWLDFIGTGGKPSQTIKPEKPEDVKEWIKKMMG